MRRKTGENILIHTGWGEGTTLGQTADHSEHTQSLQDMQLLCSAHRGAPNCSQGESATTCAHRIQREETPLVWGCTFNTRQLNHEDRKPSLGPISFLNEQKQCAFNRSITSRDEQMMLFSIPEFLCWEVSFVDSYP